VRVKVNDVWEQIVAKRKRFQKEKRVGTVSYNRTNGMIVFHQDERTTNYRYWIPFDELQEPERQMRWIYHVRGKGWFSVQVLNDFLDVLEYLGLRPPT
jgi:hypothetical protein